MAAYRYEAVDQQGQAQRGVLDADSARAARAALRERGLLPLQLQELSARRLATDGLWRPHLGGSERAMVTRQLASLLDAGLPLEQALSALQAQAEREYVRDLLAAVRTEVLSGAALSQALASHPTDFADIYRALVAAGEQSGQLGKVMVLLADYLERRNALIQKIRLAFTYPAIVTVVAVLIVGFLLAYVVPQVVSVFADSRQSLPLLTRLMLSLSGFMRDYGMVLLAGLAGLAWVIRRLLHQPGMRLRWHGWLLRAPFFGRFERSFNAARFASTLAITSAAGVPILLALQTSRDTLNNLDLQQRVEQVSARVREGMGLAAALAEHPHFPAMLIHLIRAGEMTGQLPAMLTRAADIQEQDLERRAMLLAGLLEPALILVMGVIVLLIVLAVLMPIIEINQLVR